jgi:hypothetical protein
MGGYWITGLFEVASDEGTTYHVTLEKVDCKMIMESTHTGNWAVFEKTKKTSAAEIW